MSTCSVKDSLKDISSKTLTDIIINDRSEIIWIFIRKNIDLNEIWEGVVTPLTFAALKGSSKIFTLLLDDATKKQKLTNEDIHDAFYYAARDNHVDIVKIIIEKYIIDRNSMESRMEYAANKGFYKMVKLLYKNGCNDRECIERSCLLTEKDWDVRIWKFLDQYRKTNNKKRQSNITKTYLFLKDHGALLNSELISSIQENSYERAKTLIQQGAQPNCKDGEGLIKAINNNNPKMVYLLLRNSNEWSRKCSNNALQLATRYKFDEDIIDSLLLFIEYDKYELNDALICEVANNRLDTCDYLIKKGADIRNMGSNACYLAKQLNFEELLSFLIKKDAEIHNQYKVLLQLAKTNKSVEMLMYNPHAQWLRLTSNDDVVTTYKLTSDDYNKLCQDYKHALQWSEFFGFSETETLLKKHVSENFSLEYYRDLEYLHPYQTSTN